MEISELRATWLMRQGLPRRLPPDAARILHETGWVHTAGGQLPYLSLHARSGISRAAVDEAVAKGKIHEIPSVRGCTMLVPAEDVPLALFAARAQHEKAEIEVAKKHCGVTDKELDKLSDAILKALDQGPLEPKELHAALGENKVRSLGEAGRKRGMSTTLPLSLGRLHIAGEVRRISTTGRLDNQRYRYARWRPNPIAKTKLDEAVVARELARRYFRWMGPATIQEFAWWAGLGVKAARTAAGDLQPMGDDRFVLSDEKIAMVKPLRALALVPFRDNYTSLRRELSALYDAADAKREILDWEKGSVALGQATSLHQPAILEGGRLIGLWDYDDRDQSIVCRTFVKKHAPLDEEVALLTAFIRDQLGNARYYSLDNDAQRHRRIDTLKAMRNG